ncbi:hypothetical protein ACFQU9_10795 [Actinomadura namibiensis]|uniref:Uncharacterized protein n=1 Tax=Actinomadura namibiensis TaxID=182080 RepID=A0A7W3LYA5_ACTNM|nr:hypothetical protein [Actinomadura namibiensis]MBA8956407.1 hypothetical protein [Actinomadura namibiensis]
MFLKLTAVAAAALTATGLGLWGAAPWADGNVHWRLTLDQGSVAHGKVIATGEREAWAFGWKVLGLGAWVPMVDGPHRPTAFRWDGTRWRRSDLPVERGHITAVAASSPSRVWALAGTDGGPSVLRWDGRAWTVVRRLPGTAGMGGLVAAGDDLWVFGDRRAWHYDGATWSERALPFQASRAAARSASDIWALDAEAPRVHHFDGRGWTPTDLAPALPKGSRPSGGPPPGLTGPRLTAVTAGPSGVWITGEAGVSSFVLSRTGAGWRGEDTSATAGRMGDRAAPVPDGRGGHWFLGSTDVNGDDSALAHRDASGRWTRTPVGGELTSLAAVPGGPLLATGRVGRASGVFRHLR